MTAAVQRIKQGMRALFAFAQPVDETLAARYLDAAEYVLFLRLTRGEQLHSLNVLRDVLAQGVTSRELAAAALLHDIGKVQYAMSVFQKTLPVIVRVVAPSLFDWLSQRNPSHPLALPFVVNVQHPAWGAALLAPLGTAEQVLWLVAHHADDASLWATHPYYESLVRLQQADNAN